VETPKEIELRDFFAAFALTGVLSHPPVKSQSAEEFAARIARTAYEYADAMLKERNNAPVK